MVGLLSIHRAGIGQDTLALNLLPIKQACQSNVIWKAETETF